MIPILAIFASLGTVFYVVNKQRRLQFKHSRVPNVGSSFAGDAGARVVHISGVSVKAPDALGEASNSRALANFGYSPAINDVEMVKKNG